MLRRLLLRRLAANRNTFHIMISWYSQGNQNISKVSRSCKKLPQLLMTTEINTSNTPTKWKPGIVNQRPITHIIHPHQKSTDFHNSIATPSFSTNLTRLRELHHLRYYTVQLQWYSQQSPTIPQIHSKLTKGKTE